MQGRDRGGARRRGGAARALRLNVPLDVVAVRVTRRGQLVASTGARVYSALASSRADPDAWYGRDAKLFKVGRSAATAEIRIDDRVAAGDAVYAVRDIETTRWEVVLTAERTT